MLNLPKNNSRIKKKEFKGVIKYFLNLIKNTLE